MSIILFKRYVFRTNRAISMIRIYIIMTKIENKQYFQCIYNELNHPLQLSIDKQDPFNKYSVFPSLDLTILSSSIFINENTHFMYIFKI
ncbi:MAG: hypothetical protein ACKPKO_26140 [Candidatus Fonsibacter sp.]